MAGKFKAMLLCAAAAGTCLPATLYAQTVPAQPEPAKPSAAPTVSPSDTMSAPASAAETTAVADAAVEEDAETIVVTGFRASLEAAIGLKRDAITIRDSIVAEDIGKFPEANIAEALQRIPGVELLRDGNSNEGSTIQLRGLPSTFTVTTFNGSAVYTTSGGGIGNASRNFNYDVFPSELFGRADVYKAPLAELTEGGIAGVIDLRTPRPFDQKQEFTARYAASVNNNSQSGSNNPRGNALVSWRKGNFGILIAAAGARTTNGRAGFQSTGTYSASTTNAADRAAGAIPSPIAGAGAPEPLNFPYNIGNTYNYNFAAPGINLNGLTQQQVRNAILPRFFIVGVGRNERERFGSSGALQFKNDSLDISLDGLYSVVSDENRNADIRWPIRDSVNGTPANATNQLALIPLNVTVDANNNLQGTLGNVQFFSNSGFNEAKTKYKYGAFNIAYKATNSLKVSGQLALSQSRGRRNDVGLSMDSRQARQTITIDTTDPVFPTITTTANLLDPATYFANGTTAANGTVTGGPGYSGSYREEEDRLKSGRLVVDWDYGLFGVDGHLKTGFSYNENTKILENRATNNLYNSITIPGVGPYATATLAQRNAYITSFLKPLSTRDFVPGAPTTLPQEFLAFTPDFAYDTLDAVNANRAAPFNLGSTYRATETIKAAFIQSDFIFEVFGRRVRANAGVRYVDTKSDIDNNVLVGAAFVPNNRKGKYTAWLPSATITYDLTKNLIARAAIGKTFTRAAIQNIAASISLPAGGAGNLLLTAGNPDLQPEYSKSLDGSLEWYFAPGGILSVAYYKKTITGRANTSTEFIPFNELGIPAGIFTANIQAQLAADPTTPVEVRTPINLDRYTLNGIEIAYTQQFKFLPAPFDGLGAFASFTRVNTQGLCRIFPSRVGDAVTCNSALASRNRLLQNLVLDLNDVPDTTYQLGAYYEKGKFATRVTYNHKSEVATVGQGSVTDIGFQRINNARGYLDATVSYRFAKWLEVRVDAVNITNTKTYDFFRNVYGLYGDEQSRVEGATQNGRIITAGIRGSF
ncbi:TonB-dependent receptor [Glacieibacterium frigidum]|uniref:TonB-dependent receptor n=1 Tax=Glacieibacterium frigidum TaxID=2593303 RepID=A0A552UGG6_9SPHN|nr:TonB-dependent receptor [Glacieibacterium frigidum]TRW17318.1 TonB-dependent receptor [Glacieibacterium frigidum]